MENVLSALDASAVGVARDNDLVEVGEHRLLPRYLRLLPDYGVVLCIEHQSCYAADSLGRHLLDAHRHLGRDRANTLEIIQQQLPLFIPTVDKATPPHGRREPIDGLPCYAGYYCRWPANPGSTSTCSFLSRNRDVMRIHFASHTKRSPGARARPAGKTLIQTLSSRYKRYFRVQPKEQHNRWNIRRAASPSAHDQILGLLSAAVEAETRPDTDMASDLTTDVLARFDASQGLGGCGPAGRGLATPAAHVSEATPWLRKTGYDGHLAAFDLETIGALYEKPKQGVDPVLCLICDSVDRVLRRTMGAVGNHQQQQYNTTHIVDHEARILNTFRSGDDVSLDPFRPLQQSKSVRDYILVWQELICYIYRAAEDNNLAPLTSDDQRGGDAAPTKTFRLTLAQEQALLSTYQAAADMPLGTGEGSGGSGGATNDDDGNGGEEDDSDNDQGAAMVGARRGAAMVDDSDSDSDVNDEHAPRTHADSSPPHCVGRSNEGSGSKAAATLDRRVAALSVALIEDPCTSGRTFDSAIVSFSAVKAWSPRKGSWLSASSCTSTLSKLIYCSQLAILRSCLDAADPAARVDGDRTRFRELLKQTCKTWMRNDGYGPIAELLSVRSFGMAVARTTVADASFQWDLATPGAFTYKHINFSLSHLMRLVDGLLSEASRIMEQDLCLGLPHIPYYRVSDFQDNWSTARSGDNFLTDVRNTALVSHGHRWLVESAIRDPSIRTVVFTKRGTAVVSSEFAKQYQSSVEGFLDHLMALVHMTSGMPSRRPGQYLSMGFAIVVSALQGFKTLH